MKDLKKISVMMVIITAVISSCYYDKKELVYPLENNTCSTTNVKYSVEVTGILSANCYSCHAANVANSSGGGIALDSYTAASALAASVLSQVQSGAMPKGGPQLSACNIAQIKKWVSDGAPNN